MKKSFAILIAFAMVFSMFSPAAFAADEAKTIDEKYQELAAAGIFAGVNEDGDAALEDEMTRAQAARILALLFDLDLNNPPANASFSDVPSNHWAYDAVEAAASVGFINGRTDGTFDPSGMVTKQELAIMLALGYENLLGVEIKDATVKGEIKAWPGTEKYVAFAVNNGNLDEAADYTVNATRAVLTQAAYQAYADVIGSQEVGIASAQPSNFNEITVELTGALTEDQQEDVKFEVKNDSITEKVEKVEFSKDGKTAVITIDRDFRNGTYTVTITGIEGLNEDTATAEFEATEERVAKVEFVTPSDTLPQAEGVEIEFEAVNQYGQKANLNANDFRIYVSDRLVEGTLSPSSDDQSFTIDLYIEDNDGDNELQRGQGIYLRVLHEESGVAADKTFTIGDRPIISKVEFGNLIDEDGEEIEYIRAGKTAFLEIAAYDQYGVRINNADVLNGVAPGVNEVSVFTNNRDLQVGDGTKEGERTPFTDGDGDGNVDLQLTAEEKLSGKVTVTAFSYGGSVSEVVEVRAVKKPVKVEIPRFDGILAEGDVDKYIPFKAYDVNGDELTAADIVDNADEFRISAWGPFKLASNEIATTGDDRGKIHIAEVDGRGQGQLFISIDRQPNTQVTANLNANAQRKADKLVWQTEAASSVVTGAETDFKVRIKDQYGENYKKDINPNDRDYSFYVKVKFEAVNNAFDAKLSGAGKTISAGETVEFEIEDFYDKKFVFSTENDANLGSYKVDISLHLKDNDKEIHKLSTRNIKVIDGRDSSDRLDYTVKLDRFNEEGTVMAVSNVLGSTYDTAAGLKEVPKLLKEIKIEAENSSGNKVGIKQDITNVTTSRSSIAQGVKIGDKWYVAGVKKGDANITVHFNTQNGSDVAVISVKAVDANSEVESISFSKKSRTVSRSVLTSNPFVWDAAIAEKLTVTDQYNNQFVSEKASKTETNDYANNLNLTYSVKVTDWGEGRSGRVSIDSKTGQLNIDNLGSIKSFDINVTAPNGKSATTSIFVE